MAIACSACGASVPPSTRICGACGQAVRAEGDAATAATTPAVGAAASQSRLSEYWEANRSAELGLAIAFGLAAVVLGTVAFGLGVGADALSATQAKSQIWNYAALVLAVGSLSWAVAARASLPPGVVLSDGADRTIALVLGIAAAVIALIGFFQTVGYDVLDDLESGDGFLVTFSSLDEQAWTNYAIALAFVTAAWCVIARPLSFAEGRRAAIICTVVAAAMIGLGLIMGATAGESDTLNAIVRSSGWFGVAFVLVAISIGLMHGTAPGESESGPPGAQPTKLPGDDSALPQK